MSFILDYLLQAGLTTTVAVGLFVWILRKHLSSYLGEKGKLRAQIEDIQKATRLELIDDAFWRIKGHINV